MVAAKNRVEVLIAEQRYVLVGEESTDHLEYLAALVDDKITTIRQTNSYYPTAKIAVLASLQLADELVKMTDQYEKLLHEVDLLREK